MRGPLATTDINAVDGPVRLRPYQALGRESDTADYFHAQSQSIAPRAAQPALPTGDIEITSEDGNSPAPVARSTPNGMEAIAARATGMIARGHAETARLLRARYSADQKHQRVTEPKSFPATRWKTDPKIVPRRTMSNALVIHGG